MQTNKQTNSRMPHLFSHIYDNNIFYSLLFCTRTHTSWIQQQQKIVSLNQSILLQRIALSIDYFFNFNQLFKSVTTSKCRLVQ